jgi:hypothetical protein
MTESSLVDAPLAFEGFLAHLRRLGFVIGVDQHLRMEQLIERIGGHCAPGDLKTLLCPIFAVSEKQQELFYDTFDSSFPLFVEEADPGSYRAVTVRERFYPGPPAALPQQVISSPKWLYLASAAVVAVGLIAVAVWRPRTPVPPPLATTPLAAEAPVQAPATLPPQRPEQPAPPKLEPLLTADQRREYNRTIDECLDRVRKALVVLARKNLTSQQRAAVTRIVTFQRQAEEAREQDLLTAVALAMRADRVTQDLLETDLQETGPPAVPPRGPTVPQRERAVPPREPSLLEWTSPWLAVLIPVLWFVCYELYRFRRRKLVLQKQQGKMPPHSWPIRLKASAAKIYESPAFYTAARRLHSRVRGDSPDLDIAGTVSATVRARGYPRFQYRRMTRLPDYLVLIDRASSQDHQARLFDRLASALHEEGLFLERYFYEGDPRECWREDSEQAVSLAELQRRYSGHRLLLLGDADRLIDAVSGKLTRWAGLLDGWTDRAILTPVPPSQWGVAERALANQFIVLPATQNGLLALVDYFGGSGPADARGWLDEFPSPRELDSAAMLREHLGPQAFQWLCACAVYPELHWDLTLHLGSLPSMPEGLINEADLLRLIRLPWFRSGSMPDELRWSLIQKLSAQQEREVREAIIDLIEKSPAPEESFAADAQHVQILFQRYFLVCRDAARRGIRRILEHVPEGEIQREHVVLRSLESLRGSVVDFLLPNRLRRLLFAQGTSVLGLRTRVRLLLTLAVLGVGFSAVSYWKVSRLDSEIDSLSKNSAMDDLERRTRIAQRLDLLARAPVDLGVGIHLRDLSLRLSAGHRGREFAHAPSSPEPVEVSFRTNVEAATIFVDTRRLGGAVADLSPGPHTVSASKTGYKPVVDRQFTVDREPTPVELTLEPEALQIRISAGLRAGKVLLDDAEIGVLQDGNFSYALTGSGKHTLKVFDGSNEILSIDFQADAGAPARLYATPSALDVPVTVISSLGSYARVYSSVKGMRAAQHGGILQTIPPGGRAFYLLPANSEVTFYDRKRSANVPVETGNAPVLSILAGGALPQGTLLIKAMNGARVYINGQLSPTPVQQGMWKQSLRPGEYSVRLALDGYDFPAEVKLTINAARETAQRFELKPLSTAMTLLQVEGGTPDADVWVDGHWVGKLNSVGSLATDVTPDIPHSIQFKKQNYGDSTELTRRAAVKQAIRITGSEARLKPFGIVAFSDVQPRETQLTVQRLGERETRKVTDLRMALPGGTYVVKGTAEGYEPFEKDNLAVLSGFETHVSVVLKPKPLLAIPSGPPGSLTIADVINLTKNHVSDELVILRVKRNAIAFALNADEIVELKKAGVSDAVIRYMLNPNYSPPATLTPTTGTVRLARTPSDVTVTYRRDDEAQGRELRGSQIDLPPGSYVFFARAPGYTERTERVQVAAGTTYSIDLTLPREVRRREATAPTDLRAPDSLVDPRDSSAVPPAISPTIPDLPKPPAPRQGRRGHGVADGDIGGFEEPWKQEGELWIHKGGGFVGYKLPPEGVFTFTVQLIKGGGMFRSRVRWCVQYVDSKNYLLYELDVKNFWAAVVENGKKNDRAKIEHKQPAEQKSFTVQIEVTPDRVVHRMLIDDQWVAIDTFARSGRNFAAGKFGFLIQGNDEIGISYFSFKPEYIIR